MRENEQNIRYNISVRGLHTVPVSNVTVLNIVYPHCYAYSCESNIFISNRIQVKREEIQDFDEEICQLEDKKKKLIKLVSVNFVFVKMMKEED